jgi:hypothetical protein
MVVSEKPRKHTSKSISPLEFLKDSDREIYDEIIAIKTDHVSIELAVEMLQTNAVRQKFSFLDELSRNGLYIVDVH